MANEIKIHFNTATEGFITSLVTSHKNFVMDVDRGDLMKACAKIERLIEGAGMTCRVYTKGRVAGAVFGVAGVLGTIIHNAATLNPDYEIGRNIATNTVTVTWKK